MKYLGPLVLGALLWTLADAVFAQGMTIPYGPHDPKAPGHWYPASCCSRRDCERVPIDGVTETRDGWDISYLSERFGPVSARVPQKMARHSQDGGFHACWRLHITPHPLMCFFAPVNT